MYFLLVDRFSDGNEKPELLFTADKAGSAIRTENHAERWRAAGYTFCGGTLKGARSKLEYLHQLGITTIWLSPVLQQCRYDATSYHGYGAQNFFETDPHFGSKEDLRAFVDEAHQLGMFVVLDIVVNHAGFVFEYEVPMNSETEPSFKVDGQHPVKYFHDQEGKPTLPFDLVDLHTFPEAWPYGAIWPRELQSADTFNRRGCIGDWENPDEYLHGDFKFLKDINMGDEKEGVFYPSEALLTLIKVYQYWMAYSDLDGYRLDAVKHMGIQATQYFVTQVQNFAKDLGKQNFAIFGEIPGGEQQAHTTLHQTGLTAALALLDIPQNLELMMKGTTDAVNYFQFFHSAESELAGDHHITWKKNEIVLFLDDHDQIRKNFDKARFPSGSSEWQKLAFPALATLVCSAGIPCIYYGSEQGFDGQGRHDRYIRETMFASEFGAFRSKGYHFFNEQHEIYQQLQRLLAIRKHLPALRQGDQQLLEISGDGEHFGYPAKLGARMLTLVPWLRQTSDQRILCVVSTDPNQSQSAWVKMLELKESTQYLRCIFSTDEVQIGEKYPLVQFNTNHKVMFTLPPAGFALFQFT